MRALRKIVFINSAHIRYAEVKLDGNVHFIGTQGVGKSTLLRAILFFYNADKLRLGIPKEMKTFDEFYLPHANSYIVYEVEHEHGPFCILTFRSSGRACYRFIDAEYSKNWLIGSNGEVTAEGKTIRERIGDAYMSKIIDRYEQYRDILYGNHQAVGKEFAHFHLMESNRYQDIPRSIQNVFLNSRLDANFIKDIIIRSMSEEEANIDLGYFRRQVSDFEKEYKDISCWYKLNKKGESEVRKQADTVVKAYHELLYMKQQIAELCGEFNYAVRISRERIPLLDKRISELVVEQDRQKRLLDELLKKYDEEKSSLNQKQGVVNDKLKRLKERKDSYDQQQIKDVMARCDKEQILKGELVALRTRLLDLTTCYKGVANEMEQYRQAQEKRMLQFERDKQKKDVLLFKEYQKRCDEIDCSYKEKIELATSTIEQLRQERTEVEKELLKLRYWQPYQEELSALDNELKCLALREKELGGSVSASESGILQLQAEYDRKEAEILMENKRLQENSLSQIDATQRQVAEIDKLLDRTKGSLYEWLEENKRDWEQNIGKIVDEERVLYQAGLHPQKADGNSLFGVRLDLTDLPLSVRKPTQLKGEKNSLESALRSHKIEYADLIKQQEKQEEDLKRQFSSKMKDLRQQKSMHEAELLMIPQKQKNVKVKIGDFVNKKNRLIETRTQEMNVRLQDVDKRITTYKNTLDKHNADKQKQLNLAKKNFDSSKDVALREQEQKVAEIRADIKVYENRCQDKLQEFQHKEMAELKGHGADTKMVEDCRASILSIEKELEYIESHRDLIFNYQRDKEELFDREEEFKEEKKFLADKLMQLSDKYAARKRKYEETVLSLGKKLAERKQEKTHISEDLSTAERFAQDEILCPSVLADAAERQTLRTPKMAVDELTSIIVSHQSQLNKFKQSINMFKSNFSAKNTFNFRTQLTLDDDYFEFANNLDDFLINNKIEEYRRRTSERYVDILTRVSKEIGELTRYESDVDKIIHDINKDFRDRNFAGVIKLIALQSIPSSDKMVQLMKRIKDFNDENQFAMGELNLFTSVDHGEVNNKAVGYLLDFMKLLQDNPQRQNLTLSDLFQLQFRIIENDNDTGWADKLSHVGSEGTDTLVKAMINIMLINVFKKKVSKRFGDFRIHCMMDEIGKLHPQNVKGILDFANARNILLINSSPTTYNVSDYRYTYLLSKDGKSQTVVHPLISQR